MKKILLLIITVAMFFTAYTGNFQNNAARAAATYDETLFILDFSGSMNTQMNNRSIGSYAAEAVQNIFDSAGASEKIGLKIFGSPDGISNRAWNSSGSQLCSAVSTIIPISSYARVNAAEKLQDAVPFGAAPVYYALRHAVQNDFSSNTTSRKHIILVSDGADSCGQDPCGYIRNLMSLRSDYRVDVIGIGASGRDYSQLKCIADAGKGNYYSVNSPADFNFQFKQAYESYKSFDEQANTVKVLRPVRFLNLPGVYKTYIFQFND